MSLRIALAGNPNCGKTTLFNVLTGSNQFVGNWPGVTVEKKEGRLKNNKDVIITDLPGIYSLSPYTLEEVVARNYLIGETPDAILNIVDGTNLERNLYLTTQLVEIGVPVVVAINMMDIVNKNGDRIDIEKLSKEIGCRVVEISALKETGINEAVQVAIEVAKTKVPVPPHRFSGEVEHTIAHIEEAAIHDMPEEQQRWYAIKIFERDDKVIKSLNIPDDVIKHIEKDIEKTEKMLDDDAEGIITNERYNCIEEITKVCYFKKHRNRLSTSEKIDKVLTNRFAALPIFAVIMFLVYFISMSTVGAWCTDWTNDKLFGEGFHLFGVGQSEYEEKLDSYNNTLDAIDAFAGVSVTDSGVDYDKTLKNIDSYKGEDYFVTYDKVDEETLSKVSYTVFYDAIPENVDEDTTIMMSYKDAVENFKANGEFVEPVAEDYGIFVPSIPDLISSGLDSIDCADWLHNLIIDGIVAGVGAVLGFVPQMFVLFLLLAFLEACGYMSRIAFVLDKLFRKFGLSGKSFIPMLVGMGCGVPGIMASRTIENLRDRRITIITTTFIPCGAKTPIIAMMAGALFADNRTMASFISVGAYFLGVVAIIISGIILKKTKPFLGEVSPFVMELPAYHMPTLKNVLRSMWERGWSFIKKAGTIILLSTAIVWFATNFGWVEGSFQMLSESQLDRSILAYIGNGISWLFTPLGWGNWQSAVASVTGLIAKENIVGTMGVFYGGAESVGAHFTVVSGLSFLIFNLLCAPCFAAIGAIKREMNSGKWTLFAVGYQCIFAYSIALMVNQFGSIFLGEYSIIGVAVAVLVLAIMLYMIFRPQKKGSQL